MKRVQRERIMPELINSNVNNTDLTQSLNWKKKRILLAEWLFIIKKTDNYHRDSITKPLVQICYWFTNLQILKFNIAYDEGFWQLLGDSE